MKRIKCKVSYDGTHFSGYQVQPGARTVQAEIERVLAVMHKGGPVRITASGRTDAGVHARGQVFHFDSPLIIEKDKWKTALNAQLPADIVILEAEEARPDFHARFDVTRKEYRYFILRTKDRDVFRRHYTLHMPYDLDLDAVKSAIPYFIGTHDFTAFSSAKAEVDSRIRTIYELELMEEADELVIRVAGNGFLYNMVRLIVGDLLRVGQGKLAPEEIGTMLREKKRDISGLNVSGAGLYLWDVSYH
ncbi:tRNA pseudouridine(38-40) synthase TruA [Bacillus marinisedimentorum]|uniref:tRNA pseudouridine(38-40) synthase TruA n=1 Tax=Bacillus marinisedimentorum TaxID=1821260 RepID=UPI000871D950|nr:tRNA pseudouridine(38-40) synthase TruA [Bacillus marinisedimentorum]